MYGKHLLHFQKKDFFWGPMVLGSLVLLRRLNIKQLFTQSWLTLCDPHGLQHARPPCPSTPRACSNSCLLSWWCHPAISSSVIPFSSHLQSFPASGSFQMCQFFASCGQSIGASFSFSISASNEYSGLISFRMDWFGLLAVQETLKSLLQHHISKASILWRSAFFIVQLSHPYMTTGKTIALTRWTFVCKVMSLPESQQPKTGFWWSLPMLSWALSCC